MPKRKRIQKQSESEDEGSDYKETKAQESGVSSESEAAEVIPPRRSTRSRKRVIVEATSESEADPGKSDTADGQSTLMMIKKGVKSIETPKKSISEMLSEFEKQLSQSSERTSLTTQPAAPATPSASTNPIPQSSPLRGTGFAKPKPVSVLPRKAKKLFTKPETEWRRSDIPEDIEITKGNAQAIFKLSAKDIAESGLSFSRKKRKNAQGEMHLYSMRDIERLAWRKYGSPEGFDAALEGSKEAWVKAGKDPDAFIRPPRPYSDNTMRKCKQCNVLFSSPSHLVIEKCDPCSGIVRKPYIPSHLVLSIPRYYQFDPDDYYDGDDGTNHEDLEDNDRGYNPDYMTLDEYIYLRREGKIREDEYEYEYDY